MKLRLALGLIESIGVEGMHICSTKEELLEKLSTEGGAYGRFWTELDGEQTFVSELLKRECIYWAYWDVSERLSYDLTRFDRHRWSEQKQPLFFDICGHRCNIDMNKTIPDVASFEYTEGRFSWSRKEYRETVIERGKKYLVSGYFKLQSDGSVDLITRMPTFQASISDHAEVRFKSTAGDFNSTARRFKKAMPVVIIIMAVLIVIWALSLPK